MATLAELQEQKTALEAARASGELRIRELNREITYRSMDEIDRALAAINAAIDQAEGKAPRRSQTRFVTRAGW